MAGKVSKCKLLKMVVQFYFIQHSGIGLFRIINNWCLITFKHYCYSFGAVKLILPPKGSCDKSMYYFTITYFTKFHVLLPNLQTFRGIHFILFISIGNAVCRGNTALRADCHHYWEFKLTQTIYGTAFMIGIGTEKVDMNQLKYSHSPFLGADKESWGYWNNYNFWKNSC